MQHLANNIRAARKSAGLTQKQLAAQVGVHYQSVLLWEGGHHLPVAKHIRAISRATGVSVPELTMPQESVERAAAEERDQRRERRVHYSQHLREQLRQARAEAQRYMMERDSAQASLDSAHALVSRQTITRSKREKVARIKDALAGAGASAVAFGLLFVITAAK